MRRPAASTRRRRSQTPALAAVAAGALLLGLLAAPSYATDLARRTPASTSLAAATTGPAAPATLEASSGDRGVGLAWPASTSANVSGYAIYRSTSLPVPTTGTPVNGSSLVKAKTYVDGNRTNGTTYSYVVVAVDSTGARSDPSPVASAVPNAPALPTGATITWVQKASAAIARREANGVAYNGQLYVFGGQYTGVTQTLRSDRYDPATDVWTRIRDLPELITHAPVVVDGQTLWILGGYVGLDKKDSSPRVWKYDTVTDTYSPGPALPAARGGGGAVIVGRQLHYFTGAVRMDSTGAAVVDQADHWVLDLDGGTTWTAAASVPNPRNHVGVVYLGGKVYLIGGQHADNEAAAPQVEVDAYDVATDTWSRVADLPVPRGHISASTFVWNGTILLVGGSVLGAKASATLYQYDPATNVWTTRTNLPEGLRSPVSDLINGNIIVSGGRADTVTSVKTWSGSVGPITPPPGDTTAPAAPKGLAGTVDSAPAVHLSWTAGTEPDLAGYAVYRSTSTPVATTGTPLSGAALLTGPAFVDSAVTAGTTYAYVVVARDATGNTSPSSAPATVQVPASPPATGTGVWTADTALPAQLLDAGGESVGTKIYVVGGKDSTGHLSAVRIYDTLTHTWSLGAPMPGAAVENPSLVNVNGQLYAIGGSTAAFSGAVAQAARYDPGTNTWTSVAGMGTARGGAVAVLLGQRIWVLGGMTAAGASLATTEYLDLSTGTWSPGPSLGTARDNAGAAALSNGILVLGGRTRLADGTEVAPNLASTEFLPTGGTAWQPRSPMITGRRTMATGTVGGLVIAAGGERQASGATWPQTEGYDPGTDTWRSLAPMLTPRHGMASAVVNGALHTIGGGPTGGQFFSTTHEVFTPDWTTSPPPVDTTPPAAPVGVAAVAGAGPVVTVGWTGNGEPDLAGYRVYRSTSTPVAVTGTAVSGSALLTSATFSDPGVLAGTTYYYVVVAVDTSGNASGSSAPASVQVPTSTPAGVAVKVRFATATAVPPTGYLADWGQAYGARTGTNQGSGLTYGWVKDGTTTAVDLTKNGRLRTGTSTTDARLTGLMHMDWQSSAGTSGTATPGAWELAVPNGSYTVTVSVGDAGPYYNSTYQANIEGQNALAGVVLSNESPFSAATRTVFVADGRLTVSQAGGVNTKLNYVEVQSAAVAPRIAQVTPQNLATGATTDVSVTAGLAVTAGGIDASTLTSATARLTVAAGGTPVDAHVNTSGGGDVIVLTPTAPLTSGTTYRFDVTSGVRDVAGNPFQPWSSVFTVGTASAGTGIAGVAFDKLATSATGYQFTSVTMGPDGWLYAATLDGYVVRYPVAADGSLGTGQRIDTVRVHAGGFPRTIIGLAFDPAATASNLILWTTVNLQYLGTANVADWSGSIVRLSGPNLEQAQDVVVGLPRSARDHESNSLAFKDGMLYLTQGSNTAMGAPDAAWAMRDEHVLSAAVLRLDPAKLPGQLPIDVKTADGGGTYDPAATGAPLTLYATGVRNAYDLVWHSNGHLYAPTNGSALGGSMPATPSTLPAACANRSDGPWTGPAAPAVVNNPVDETDWVFKIAQGGYYGHPDPARCEWAFNGGNPTSGVDQYEATAYPVGVQPDRNYRSADVFDAGLHASADGAIEYLGNNFGGALKGKLVVVRYSASQDLMVIDPSGTDGAITRRSLGVTGFTGFNQPLDVAQHVPTGDLYVTELGGQKITRLVPRG